MNREACAILELNKILDAVADCCSLEGTKDEIRSTEPETDPDRAEFLLRFTEEADRALYRAGCGRIEPFPALTDEISRAGKGAVLSCGELLGIHALLYSARTAYESVFRLDDGFPILKDTAHGLLFDRELERDIREAVLSEDELADTASAELYRIRTQIRTLNEKIRARLAEAVNGPESAYLQNNAVTMRDNRYVLPVRAEYRGKVRGFVHDRSATGATYFIEPAYVLEMNNELRELQAAEREETERILRQFSRRTGDMAEELAEDMRRLYLLDGAYARAEYAYSSRSVIPGIRRDGIVRIEKGRHPLLERGKAVPVSVSFGTESCRFLLVSGPNTGGKTVTMKMCGLFCLMAACGLFLPAAEGTEVSVFPEIYCDIGDAQSIEENLSTFSSHMRNVVGITDHAGPGSLVLIDELGGGTDPDEGQAIARAVLSALLRKGCRGIVTTHYTSLKEFAYGSEGIENASMEFDQTTLQPLYRLRTGIPGSSNALAISGRLGLSPAILEEAAGYLAEQGRSFENILRLAEQSRQEADAERARAKAERAKWESLTAEADRERAALKKERDRMLTGARAESRRIVSERTARADALLAEIEEIFAKETVTESDMIRARTLKNRMKDQAYVLEEEDSGTHKAVPASADTLVPGDRVEVNPGGVEGDVVSVNPRKGEAEILCGSIRMKVKIDSLSVLPAKRKETGGRPKQDSAASVRRAEAVREVKTEINLLGMTVMEAIPEVDAFLDRAVLSGVKEVRIIHGLGTGRLRDGIRSHLNRHRNVESMRPGVYGEGGAGVTVVTLK